MAILTITSEYDTETETITFKNIKEENKPIYTEIAKHILNIIPKQEEELFDIELRDNIVEYMKQRNREITTYIKAQRYIERNTEKH